MGVGGGILKLKCNESILVNVIKDFLKSIGILLGLLSCTYLILASNYEFSFGVTNMA